MNIFSFFGRAKAAEVIPATNEAPQRHGPKPSPGPSDKEAMTSEGTALGMWWEMPENATEQGFPDAVLHQEDAPKVWASVDMNSGYGKGKVAWVGTFGAERGGLEDSYATLDEGMAAAESWALLEMEREAQAFSAELSDDFLQGASEMRAQRDAQAERGSDMDSGLDHG